jgi:AraC family transcriptional regulator of adaptative response/methylated-DNA-[protein]-cysteine methyltransferase
MMETRPSEVQMRRATYGRDASFDGAFYVDVRSTGVFCRPSCPARKPREKNIVFFGSVRECLLAGLRPCKRCRPLSANGDDGSWLTGLLERVERRLHDRITDADLAGMGISPYRVRRYFQRNFQMTFQAYHRARRMGMALTHLRGGEEPAGVAYDQGYESLSGFREAFKKVFGAPPGKAGHLRCVRTMRIETPLGPMVAGAVDEGVCFLEFADRRAFSKQLNAMQLRLGATAVPGRHRHLDQLAAELNDYFEGRRREFSVPITAPGSEFQERVWAELRRIPYGSTISYAALARNIGQPQAVRAVGRANGENRIAILIPCHRVVREDGTLCGYGGGRWRKQRLLELEQGREGRNSEWRIANCELQITNYK